MTNDLGIRIIGPFSFLGICVFIRITGNVYLVLSMLFLDYSICSSRQASEGEKTISPFYRKGK